MQSSPALARIASGTFIRSSARTASSWPSSTKSAPSGSTRLAGRLSVIGRLIACTTNCFGRVPVGQRLQGPFSPGCAGSVPGWMGSRNGAGPWLGANGGRLPRCGRRNG